jgi:hypothetical protein
LINITGELRVRITIIEKIVAETNIARTILLGATMKKKHPKPIRRSKI